MCTAIIRQINHPVTTTSYTVGSHDALLSGALIPDRPQLNDLASHPVPPKKPEHKQFTYVIEWKAIVLGAPRCKHVYVCVIVCIHTDVGKKPKLIMIYCDIQQELPASYIYLCFLLPKIV